MMRQSTCAGLILIALIALQSCNEPPTEIGKFGFIDTVGSVSISSATVKLLDSSVVYLDRTVSKAQGILYVGRSDSTIVASLSQVSTYDSHLDSATALSLGESNIDSVAILLPALKQSFGILDSSKNRLAFDMVKVIKKFNVPVSGTTNYPSWDKIYSSGSWSPDYFSPTPMASYDAKVRTDSSFELVCTPNLSEIRKVVLEWLKLEAQYPKAPDSLRYGFALLPRSTSTVIHSFDATGVSGASRIRLKVFYHNNSNVKDSLTIASTGDMINVADGGTLQAPLLTAQNFVRQEARLYFDINAVPKTTSILAARLTVNLDTTKSFFSNVSDTTSVLLEFLYEYAKDSTRTLSTGVVTRRAVGSNKIVVSNMASPIINSIKQSGGKGFIRLSSYQGGAESVERIAFYGLAADSALRPELMITSVEKPTFNNKK